LLSPVTESHDKTKSDDAEWSVGASVASAHTVTHSIDLVSETKKSAVLDSRPTLKEKKHYAVT